MNLDEFGWIRLRLYPQTPSDENLHSKDGNLDVAWHNAVGAFLTRQQWSQRWNVCAVCEVYLSL